MPVMLAARVCETWCRPVGIAPPLYPCRVEFFSKNRAADISNGQRMPGFAPQVSLREGVGRTADWYVRQGWL